MVELIIDNERDAREYIVRNMAMYMDEMVVLASSPVINCIAASLLAPIAKALFVRVEGGYICIATRCEYDGCTDIGAVGYKYVYDSTLSCWYPSLEVLK
jgi:hypothetical protein